jgi:O-acetylhomoserine/O-acetylserine sulfhydrylase-like pyridoxal-dependent enzyme
MADGSTGDRADFERMRLLSPRRKTSAADSVDGLVDEQLAHFGVDPSTELGGTLARLARRLYECQVDADLLWAATLRDIQRLPLGDRITLFNAKKFLCFQLAKVLDTLQNPLRRSYQSLDYALDSRTSKGPFPVFDNVTAIFSANPVIARTATYIFACAEWIEDAFQGRELLLEIYSRLLNPTSVALANHIVDLEAGPYAGDYFAWNFNSGMAAIDAVLSHLLGRRDILITSRNIYGGSFQLIHDWFGKSSNLEIAVQTFDGCEAEDFLQVLDAAAASYTDRISEGRKIYVYLESPCNPHGDVLDVPGICKAAHKRGLRVILDATVATPFLFRPLDRADPSERPDFVIHSYTKDLSGAGSVIAGVVIGRNEDMFLPKGSSANGIAWNETLFWNVFYVKGAFLNADAAFEVLQGIKTLDLRMLAKCINTRILADALAAHPDIDVNCPGLASSPNRALCERLMYLGLPAPLFTISMERVPRDAFRRFFDNLAPTFAHMISLGQSNTIIACPALTTHSELDDGALAKAGIGRTTIRIAVGDENPRDLISHLIATARRTIDPDVPGFSDRFPNPAQLDDLIRRIYLDTHTRHIDGQRLGNAR